MVVEIENSKNMHKKSAQVQEITNICINLLDLRWLGKPHLKWWRPLNVLHLQRPSDKSFVQIKPPSLFPSCVSSPFPSSSKIHTIALVIFYIFWTIKIKIFWTIKSITNYSTIISSKNKSVEPLIGLYLCAAKVL